MHGRVRVRRTEEQERIRREVKEKLSHEYKYGVDKIFKSRCDGLYSEKQLSMIDELIEKAAETGTLWNYRREILNHLFMSPDCKNDRANCLLNKELELTTRCLYQFPKSYAVWFHRVWVLKNHRSPSWDAEVQFCNAALLLDGRNFHCWDYRRFVVSQGKIPIKSELSYSEKAIESNMSNFSAWHYRSELLSLFDPPYEASLPLSPPPSRSSKETQEFTLEPPPAEELELTHNAIYTDPQDQSPWFYYWWLLGRGIRKAYLRELYVSRSLGRIVLVFTAAKPYSALKQLDVQVKVTYMSMEPFVLRPDQLDGWQSALEQRVSAVWSLSISPDLIFSHLPESVQSGFDPALLEYEVDVCLKNVTNSREVKVCRNPCCPPDHLFCLTCTLDASQNESLTRVDLDPLRLLNSLVSPTNEPEQLQNELSNVSDLVSMEPDNKMALTTYVELLRFVHPPGSVEDVDQALIKLITVDYERADQHREKRASHAVQDKLVDAFNEHSREISLVGLNLSNMRYLDWFTLMTKIDLTGNKVSKFPDTIAYLVCLVELVMDDNLLVTLKGISLLPSLLVFYARRNRLTEFSAIQELLSCPKLESVSIDGNLVTELPDFTRQLAEHPSSKSKSQSFLVIYNKVLNG